MVQAIAQILRDFEVDGVPSSGEHQVDKAEFREWGTRIENFANVASVNSGTIFATRAALFATLGYPANTEAWVIEDPTAAYNGIYRKLGATNTGSWVRAGDLPYSYINGVDSGAGTPDAIKVTTQIPVSESSLVMFDAFEANTGSPVTVSFNNNTPLTLKTNSGNDVAPGGLTAGLQIIARVDLANNRLRMITDQVNAAIVAAAEAAQAAAETARDQAEDAAANALESTKLRGYLYGGEISNNLTDLANDLDIAGGNAATDDVAPGYMTWNAVTIQADAAYGTGSGGRFDSALSDGTWYIFAITDGLVTKHGISKSLNPTTQPNYPASFTKYRYLGSRVRLSGSWVRVVQRGDYNYLYVPAVQNGGAAIATATTAALLTLSSIPTGVEVDAMVVASYTSATVSAGSLLTSPLVNDPTPGAGQAGGINVGHVQVASQYSAARLNIRTNTSGQIRHRSGASGSLYITLHGWVDDRGANVFKTGGGSSGLSAVGNDVRSSAYATLQLAINAAAGKKLIIEAGSYVTTGLTGVSDIEITTSGPVTISTTTNAPILDMTGCTNWSINGQIRFVGNATPYTGYPGSLSDAGQKGIKISNCDRYSISGKIEFANINGSGLFVEASAGGWQHEGVIKGIRAQSCYHGIRYTNVAEYDQISDFSISNCAFAVRVESGNNMFANGKMTYNSVCVSLAAGSNDAHGEFVNCQMNHSNYAVDATGITLGEVFTGCIALGNQAGAGHGTIRLTNSVGIIWNGGQIGADISLDATSKMGVLNAYIRSGLTAAPAVDPGGVFTAKNNIVDTGGLWAYNN